MHPEVTDCHFTLADAARYLSKSPRWLQAQLTGPNPPPAYRLGKGKLWLFRKSELDAWLEQYRVTGAPESPADPPELS